MARLINRLSTTEVKSLKGPGYFSDGGGLYLRIADGGSKSWVFRFTLNGRTREAGLGSYPDVSLADARENSKARKNPDSWRKSGALDARECRELLATKRDPIEYRKECQAKARIEAATMMTFDECAKAYITAHEPAWRNAKHRQQWTNTLKTFVSPVFGRLPVQAVDTDLVLKVIEPIWTSKPETAGRVRGRIEVILDWATTRGRRAGENPARWRGHLEHQLPAKAKIHKVAHHPALPYEQVGIFLADLRRREGVAARALEFTILCATRTGDIIGDDRNEKPAMRRSHVNFKERIWTIPSTKTDTEHRVPLSSAAMSVLAQMGNGDENSLMFPGPTGDAFSNMAMASVVVRMNDDRVARALRRYVDPKQGNRDATVHGFRSTFRDWAGDRTNVPNHVAEMALGHAISNNVEAAYRRSELFDKRRRLMEAWAAYCSKPESRGAEVIPMRA